MLPQIDANTTSISMAPAPPPPPVDPRRAPPPPVGSAGGGGGSFVHNNVSWVRMQMGV
jgi:hypothetical protein